jgi:hypothetical protein
MSERFMEQILESQPGSGASLMITGGFMNAATSSLKRVTGRILKLVSVFKEANKNFAIKTNKILKTTSA